MVITSADAMQFALEDRVLNGEASASHFVRALKEGLETGDADRIPQDGKITIDELVSYLRKKMKELGSPQRPSKWTFGSVDGDLVFAYNPRAKRQSADTQRNPLGKIFINYSRDDSASSAGRIYDRLNSHFAAGQIFIDVNNLVSGVDFMDTIKASVGSCDVFIAVIGKRWLRSSDEEGNRRLDNPNDFVRLEIVTALRSKTWIIPVLVEGARMPHSDDFPDDLKPLLLRQALEMSHDHFNEDLEQLIAMISWALKSADEERKHRWDLEQRQGKEQERPTLEQRRREESESIQARKEALEWFQKAAKKGNARAITNLGRIYEQGSGVDQDYNKALECYQEAAESGSIDAVAKLGRFYQEGLGVAQDYAKAREWHQKAADGGDATAMFNLGLFYDDGLGVGQDYSKAREWYQRAADSGETTAMFNLGRLYENGLGVAQDYSKTRAWYQQAADGGNAEAMFKLGVLYEDGLGVDRDYTEARAWYQKAADSGDSDAKQALLRFSHSS